MEYCNFREYPAERSWKSLICASFTRCCAVADFLGRLVFVKALSRRVFLLLANSFHSRQITEKIVVVAIASSLTSMIRGTTWEWAMRIPGFHEIISYPHIPIFWYFLSVCYWFHFKFTLVLPPDKWPTLAFYGIFRILRPNMGTLLQLWLSKACCTSWPVNALSANSARRFSRPC